MEEQWETHQTVPPLGAQEVCTRIASYAGARPVRGYTRCAGGLVNQNVVIDLGEPAERVVLRLYARAGAEEIAAKEAGLLRRLADVLPAPRLLELTMQGGRPQAVLSFLPGARLADRFGDLDDESLQRAGQEIGCALARLHAHERPCLGWLDGTLEVAEPMGDLPTVWRTYLEQALTTGRAAARMDAALRADLLALAARASGRLAPLADTHVLLHGDCKPTNILVRADGSLSGLLDWEFAFAGPALFDLGQMLRWPLPAAFERSFVASYEGEGARLPDGWRALARMLDLVNLVGFLDGEAERPTVFRDCRRMIRETLTTLRP